MRDEQFSDEDLTDYEWYDHLLFERPIASMLSAEVLVFSDPVLCRGPGASDPTLLQLIGKRQNML